MADPPRPTDDDERAAVLTLPKRSGRSLGEWVSLVRAHGPPTEKARRAWLRAVHKLGANAAWWVAERAEQDDPAGTEPAGYVASASEIVDAMFSGKRAALRPVYDAVLDAAGALGGDVRVSPGRSVVPFYRARVFAQAKPTSATRIDLGLALGDAPAGPPLIETGGLARKGRITHRIPLGRVEEVDDAVRGWLRRAYELDAG